MLLLQIDGYNKKECFHPQNNYEAFENALYFDKPHSTSCSSGFRVAEYLYVCPFIKVQTSSWEKRTKCELSVTGHKNKAELSVPVLLLPNLQTMQATATFLKQN